jgi:hypothetical protein
MRRAACLIYIGLCLGLTGCQTPYQPLGFGGGIEVTRLGDDLFRIHAAGNGFTEANRLHDFILLQGAELALTTGHTHFVVNGSSDYSRDSAIVRPGSISTTTTGTVVSGGGVATGTARTTGTIAPPTVTKVSKLRAEGVVRVLNNPPADMTAYDAAVVYNELASMYE